MEHLCRVETWRWILSACLFSWISQAAARPQYMVAIPAVLEAGSEAKFCVDFLQLKETVTMTISLSGMRPFFQKTSNKPFHLCRVFQAPAYDNTSEVQVVVQGQTFQSMEKRKIMFKAYTPLTFIQTDKPFYLPGQTVKFRVVTMDTKFRPVNQLYNTVEIEDANGNRIGQWLNQRSIGTILQSSYSLNPEAHEGTYKVIVQIDDRLAPRRIYHSFKVEKYVLPKFDVNVKAREEISIEEDEFTAEVCAMYTFGHPVPGKAEVELCRSLKRGIFIPLTFPPGHPEGIPGITPPCRKESKQTDKSGCASFTFKMSDFTGLDPKDLEDRLHLNSKVEEDGTGVMRPQGKVIDISYAIGELSFIYVTSKLYAGKSVIEGKVKARYLNGMPIPGMLVYMFQGEGQGQSARNILTLKMDGDGVAAFSFNTSNSGEITLTVGAKPDKPNTHPSARTPYYVERQHRLSVGRRPGSSLEVEKVERPLPCSAENPITPITVHYTVAGETAGPVDLMYLVLSKATIIKQGLVTVQVLHSSVTEGEISLKLEVSPEMSPLVELLVYAVLPSEKIIAHRAEFTTEKCFSNNVSLAFSPSAATPGEQSTLQVSAVAGSLCGISAVDQSVLVKEPGKQLDADKVFDLLKPFLRGNIPFELDDGPLCDEIDHDFEVFKDLGLKMVTNLVKLCNDDHLIHAVSDRIMDLPRSFAPGVEMGWAPSGPGIWSSPLPPPMETIRTFFPETWIWELVEMGDSGVEDIPVTVPDTITTWETEAFCLSPTRGFSLAPRKELRAFKPFFLDLSLPYSVIRGESFVLKATVFNYQSSCIMVSVTPRPSSDYTLSPVPGEEHSACLCANGRKTFHWTLDVSVLGVVNVSVSAEAVMSSDASCGGQVQVSFPERGLVDGITRSLIVKAEGTEMVKTDSWLLCPEGETLTKEIKLQLHDCVQDFVIWGSVRSSVSVLGDILGRVMLNLSGLLRMPYGCGEQSMARLAPNIYILEYLKSTGQLTPAVNYKVTQFLKKGFQRLQYFRYRDGSYTTFGIGQGNTWLTAFVLKSLVKAKSFIYIDRSNIDQARKWLELKQQRNGCFKQSGKLLNNRQRGGVSDEVTLTAYITVAFLEISQLPPDPVVTQSLSCLREAIDEAKKTNTYTTALMAYAFSLAGETHTETRTHLLQHLYNNSLQDGGFLYWSQTSNDTSASLSVEMSSYVLLALLTGSPTTEELSDAARIVRWLARQQNSYGGFKSTQDTVVAIQALSLYSALVSGQKGSSTETKEGCCTETKEGSSTETKEGSSTVTIKSYSGWETFHVDQSNRLLYQERALRDLCGKYILEVKGDACVSVQMSIRYNIAAPAKDSNLTVDVSTEASCVLPVSSHRPHMTVKLQSLYTGDKTPTNMVLIEVAMLSGFVPEPESWSKLKNQLGDRLTLKDNCVHIYLEELHKDMPINHELQVIQEVVVQNLKPALVKIYDYYHPSEHWQTEYSYPCASQ